MINIYRIVVVSWIVVMNQPIAAKRWKPWEYIGWILNKLDWRLKNSTTKKMLIVFNKTKKSVAKPKTTLKIRLKT